MGSNKKSGLLHSLARNCADAVREFPVALVYLTVFALVVALPDIKYTSSMTLGIPCLMACLGSLGTSLVTAGKGRGFYIAGQIVAQVMALLYLLMLDSSNFFEFNRMSPDNRMEILSSLCGYMVALWTLVLFPFWYKGKFSVYASWSTTMRGIVGMMRAGLVAVCVLIAMLIITVSGDVLLDITIFGKFWLTFVPVMIFGALSIAGFSIKRVADKPFFRLAPFSRGVFTFVSVPLLTIYLLIFYLYLVKVVATGATPVRDLSFQAVGVFLAFCVQRYVFHQALCEGDNVVARWFNKLSPWLLFLPVVMMSWVIWQRIEEYGLTVSRLYVVLVNLWMYGVLVWWIVTKGEKIWVIPVSLCTVMTLSSVTNLNVSSVTESSMRSALRDGMKAAGWTLPVSDTFFRQNSWEALTARQRSQKAYLENEMGTGSLRGLIKFDNILTNEADNNDDQIWATSVGDDNRLFISSKCYATFDTVPEGCVAVNVEEYLVEDISLNSDSVILSIGDHGSLIFSMAQLLDADDSRRGGLNKIQVIGATGKIKGGCISSIYINGKIAGGTFRGRTYSLLTGTIFLTNDAAGEFIKDKK